MPTEPKSLVVIPTYNEAPTIRVAVEGVLESASFDVLVVDDGSPDGTPDIVERMNRPGRMHLLRRASKQGLGRAYIAGFEWGLERGYERFVEMDGDLSHDPAKAAGLVAATNDADLVIGSRYVEGGQIEGWSRSREALSKAGNHYARALLGFSMRDSTSGFRCYRREVLEAIGLEDVLSEGYAFQIEMTYRTWRLGFNIKEIPILFVERRAGSSKMSSSVIVEAVLSVARWGLKDILSTRRFRAPR